MVPPAGVTVWHGSPPAHFCLLSHSHSHLISQLHSPVLSALPHRQSTRYIYIYILQPHILSLFFVNHANFSSTLLLPTLVLRVSATVLAVATQGLPSYTEVYVFFLFRLFDFLWIGDPHCVALLAVVWALCAFPPVAFTNSLSACLSLIM